VAKIKKRKLSWIESGSSQVIGYKLYWSENGAVDYDSRNVMLGNVTEIVLPDDVESFKPGGGPVKFGVTAVDELGNESDMITLQAPYQFNVPEPPDDLYLQKLDDYYITYVRNDDSDKEEQVDLVETVETADHSESEQWEDDLDIFEQLRLVSE
jgi:hypothetical protein